MNAYDTPLLRDDFPLFATQTQPLHYLDNAATAQMHRCAFEAMREHDISTRANVLRGNHRLAEAATAAYESARRAVANFLHTRNAFEVVFTSGTTSAINLVAGSFGQLLKPGDEIVVSEAEHHSNFLPWQALRARGALLRVLPLDREGRIATDDLGRHIGPRCRLVAITHASNVTGAVTDVPAVVDAAKAVGARVLLDCAQSAQHGPLDARALGVDFLAFSGHKCFGPTGIGVLWGKAAALAALPPWMTGGGMIGRVALDETTWADPPRRFEAGTPPIAQAIGLGAALDWMSRQDWKRIRLQESRLLARLLIGLRSLRGVRVLGPATDDRRLPVVSFVLADHHPHDVCQVLDEHGVALRGGHHCAQPLMDFFGVPGAVRASIALYNDERDIDALLTGLEDAARVLR